MKKLFIKTYGCQMNVYDSQKMEDSLANSGFKISEEMPGSDLVILNTCHIREKATEKLYSELGRIKKEKEKLKEQGKEMLIAVAGCVAQAEGEEIIKRSKCVDIVVGPQSYQRLPEMVANAYKTGRKITELDFSAEEKFDVLPEESKAQGASAFLTIQEGCDKFCTFCVVPYTRGAEYSRPVSEIYREAIRLVNQGAKEISLLGQNVNAYHGSAMVDGKRKVFSLADLIKHISTIRGLERIRYTTSHPRDMAEDLIKAHGEISSLMPFLHLPVQSGSDYILQKMNRKHTADLYFKIIADLRKTKPDIAFSSDFIVGFPGETKQDFIDTMELVRKVKFAQCYSFKYSARPGTPAADKDDIPEDEKSERLYKLQALLNQQQTEFNESCVGKNMKVLFEKKGRHAGQIIGKSPYMQSVHSIAAEGLVGKIVDVKITDASKNSLSGIVV